MAKLIARRTFLIVIFGAMTTLAGVFVRIVQVAAFSIVAGVRRQFVAQTEPHGSFVVSTVHSGGKTQPFAVQNGKGMITYHPAYDRYDSERVTRALQEAAALGATYLRTDVNWRDIMPSPGEINLSALEWYASFFAEARQGFGFMPQVVLSNPASSIAQLPTDRSLELWSQYIAAVVKSVGGNCRHFQLLNELNNPVFRFFPTEVIPAALRTAASIIRRDVRDARLGINFIIDIWPWQDQLQNILSRAFEAIDVVGIDTYPGTWSIGIGSENEELSAHPQILRARLPALRADQALAVSETGYSTNIPFIRDQRDQLEYFRKLRSSADDLKGLEFVGIYELTDWDSNAKPDPEANFGLLDSRLRRKPAFDEVRSLFDVLNS